MPKRRIRIREWGIAITVCLFVAAPLGARKNRKDQPPQPANTAGASGYDVSRDPAKDLQNAIAEATRTKKRILLEVGGDWCVYCNIMDSTFESHPELKRLLVTRYVAVKINYSKENPNDAFLSKYPRILDYPHFFVLDYNGALLRSQPTHPFEHGKNYNAGKIEGFLKKYSEPPRQLLKRVS